MQRGFTLLEMVVVVVLVGLASTLAIPAMQRWHDAVQARAHAAGIVEALRAAIFNAAATRREALVDAASFAPSPAALAGSLPASSPMLQTRPGRSEQIDPGDAAARLPLPLPDGWRLEKSDPIRIHSNGLCSGGSLLFTTERQQALRIVIGGPTCSVEVAPVHTGDA